MESILRERRFQPAERHDIIERMNNATRILKQQKKMAAAAVPLAAPSYPPPQQQHQQQQPQQAPYYLQPPPLPPPTYAYAPPLPPAPYPVQLAYNAPPVYPYAPPAGYGHYNNPNDPLEAVCAPCYMIRDSGYSILRMLMAVVSWGITLFIIYSAYQLFFKK